MLAGRFSPSYITVKQVKLEFSRYALGSLGGCFAEQEQNCAREQCYADNDFNHAHNLTPFPGALEIETALRRVGDKQYEL